MPSEPPGAPAAPVTIGGWRLPEPLAFVKTFVDRIQQDRLTQMAASLAYRTLLGLVPVLVVATIAARSIMGSEFPEYVAAVVSSLGFDSIQVVREGGNAALGDWIKELVAQAGGVNLATLGWVGVGVVIFTAIWLVAGIDDSLNQIARAAQGRAWTRRIVLYWFLLTAGPLLIGVVPLVGSKLSKAEELLPAWEWLLWTTRLVFSVGVTWLLLWIVYTVVPTAELRSVELAVGALAAAILIEAGRRFLGAYVMHVFRSGGLYGSLGVAPVFMLWLYFMWMFVLLGVSIAAHFNQHRGARLRRA